MGSNLAIYLVVLVCLALVGQYAIRKKGKTSREAVKTCGILAVVAGIPIAAQVIGLVLHPFA